MGAFNGLLTVLLWCFALCTLIMLISENNHVFITGSNIQQKIIIFHGLKFVLPISMWVLWIPLPHKNMPVGELATLNPPVGVEVVWMVARVTYRVYFHIAPSIP